MPVEEKVKKIDGFDEFEVQSAASTLKQEKAIRDNPKLHRAALKLIKKEQKINELILREGGRARPKVLVIK